MNLGQKSFSLQRKLHFGSQNLQIRRVTCGPADISCFCGLSMIKAPGHISCYLLSLINRDQHVRIQFRKTQSFKCTRNLFFSSNFEMTNVRNAEKSVPSNVQHSDLKSPIYLVSSHNGHNSGLPIKQSKV